MNRLRLTLFVLLAFILLTSCATSKYDKSILGKSIDEIRSLKGKEALQISHPDYLSLLYNFSDESKYEYFKFEEGKLVDIGTINKSDLSNDTQKANSVRSCYSISIRLIKNGLKDEGYNNMLKFIDANPDSLLAVTYLANLYCDNNLKSKSINLYKSAISKQEDKRKQTVLKVNLMAQYIRQTKTDEAIKIGEEILSSSEEQFHYSTHYNMACIYSLKNDSERATEHLSKILKSGDKGFTKTKLDNDSDFDNIRMNPEYIKIYEQLP